ncbi:hypothetical protein EYZ11_000357 [Aspergillus tanneri]|uniref:Methyltransferase domain-containing protein n=1 Tax=Aspergillus tanneri TaxID=1220188 RepID=A0A4S3JXE8_9EURO|nr:uncharacterized protein ATNIH1004_004321 [Aspergillus tanneri]KAA8648436.1 hypothetical protein ATNIH1004_004321 [Aspergillus tanneri]THD00166.1 hypothetical protein EYZ11_000357 [Aspergillus tanneri]
MTQPKDHWSAEAYSTSASFVPKLAQTLLQFLDPQPTDKILDVGCGDGKFTEAFIPAVETVLGVDSSPAMIESATKDYGGPKAEFRVVDCCYLDRESSIVNGTWDKVISNAALHWILRNESTRMSTLKAIYACLKQGGTYVFEMGGHGNVSEVHTALIFALVQQGIPIEKARKTSPWFFPSVSWMTNELQEIGFKVEKMETEYRPTKLTDAANGGLAGWVRLMGAPFLDVLPAEKREAVVQQVCEVLQTVVTRHEDGSQWLGYVRLRGIAKKP